MEKKKNNVSVKLGLKKVYTILEIADSISDAIVNGEKYLIEIGSKILTDLKKNPEKNQGFAEKEGFEPPYVLIKRPSTSFQDCRISHTSNYFFIITKLIFFDHSAISPNTVANIHDFVDKIFFIES